MRIGPHIGLQSTRTKNMKFLHLLLFAAGMCLLASAQADQAMPAAADLNAAVSPLQYHAVFLDHVAARELPRSPDKHERKGAHQ